MLYNMTDLLSRLKAFETSTNSTACVSSSKSLLLHELLSHTHQSAQYIIGDFQLLQERRVLFRSLLLFQLFGEVLHLSRLVVHLHIFATAFTRSLLLFPKDLEIRIRLQFSASIWDGPTFEEQLVQFLRRYYRPFIPGDSFRTPSLRYF